MTKDRREELVQEVSDFAQSLIPFLATKATSDNEEYLILSTFAREAARARNNFKKGRRDTSRDERAEAQAERDALLRAELEERLRDDLVMNDGDFAGMRLSEIEQRFHHEFRTYGYQTRGMKQGLDFFGHPYLWPTSLSPEPDIPLPGGLAKHREKLRQLRDGP